MKKKNRRIVIFGLILGLLIGSSIIVIKAYIRSSLVAMLDDMARRGANCSFDYDRVKISLLGLSASAVNPRLVCDGKRMFGFENLQASFSLENISEHEVGLTELNLEGGYTVGVFEDSPTYQFIDFLVAPIPPEKDLPGRWKLRLYNLNLLSGQFTDQVGEIFLKGDNITLIASRTPEDNFLLIPKIGALSIFSERHPLVLNDLTTKIGLLESKTTFHELTANTLSNEISGGFDLEYSNPTTIDGSFSAALSPETFGSKIKSTEPLAAKAELSGLLRDLKIKGSLISKDKSSIEIGPGLLTINDLESELSASIVNGKLSLNSKIHAHGPGLEVKTLEPLQIENGNLLGGISAKIANITWSKFTAYNLALRLDLQGRINSPSLDIQSDAEFFGVLGKYVQDISGHTHIDSTGIELELKNRLESFHLESKLSFAEKSPPKIDNFSLQINAVPLVERSLIGVATPTPFLLNLNGKLDGALSTPQLNGSASLELLSSTNNAPLLNGNISLSNQILNTNVTSSSQKLKANSALNIADNSGTVSIVASDFSLQELDARSACSLIDGTLNYQFTKNTSSGLVKLNNLSFGCSPYTLTLEKPRSIPIKNDSFEINSLNLLGGNNNLQINGSISTAKGYDFSANGTFNLNSLLPLIPKLDDLKGILSLKLALNGPINDPALVGTASLSEGEFAIQRLDIGASDIEGSIKLTGSAAAINQIHGLINNGNFDLTGTLHFSDPTGTHVTIKASDINLTPIDGGTLATSSELTLQPSESGKLSLSGTVNIDRAELQRDITLKTLIAALVKPSTNNDLSYNQNSLLNKIDLDIAVNASHNIFLIANWAEAELKTDLLVSGTLDSPIVQGDLEALSGWFGLRSRRFSVASAAITFNYPFDEPILDLVAETQVPSFTGESTLIVLDAKGPVSSPRLKFHSDSGLSEGELVTLVTQSGIDVSSSLFDDITDPFGNRIKRSSSTTKDFFKLLKRLTDIDSLGIEPSYNERTGALEPQLVAEKNITDRFKIIGKNSFSNETRSSGIFGSFDLSRAITLSSGFENLPLEDVAAYSANINFSILKTEPDFLEILINGNSELSNRKIMSQLRLEPTSRIPWKQSDTLIKELSSLYSKQGYFDSKISVDCIDDGEFCRKLTIDISEGDPTRIKEVFVEGDDIDQYLSLVSIPKPNSKASELVLTKFRTALLARLRSDGYIEANIKLSYVPTDLPNIVNLKIRSDLGSAVTFIFKGNKEFSAEDFLETINLFGRDQPFGKNTVYLLLENIEQLYRQEGYIYATISHSQTTQEDSGRISHFISIDEGNQVSVSKVLIQGDATLSKVELAKLIAGKDAALSERFQHPKYAIQEEVDYFSNLIKGTLKERGFPDADVSNSISFLDDKNVNIIYSITTGTEHSSKAIKIKNWPSELKLPNPGSPPFSIPNVNSYIDTLSDNLIAQGYLHPTILAEEKGDSTIELEVNSGDQTTISDIFIVGNSKIESDLIRAHLGFKEGDPWNTDAFTGAQRQLLRLGLFSRIEFVPADDTLDSGSEPLLIKVVERGLRSLDVGMGYNSVYGLRVFGEYIDRALFADGRSLGLRVDTYYDSTSADISKGTASLRYIDPIFWSDESRLTEELRFQRLQSGVLPFDIDRISFSSFTDRAFSNRGKVALGHTLSLEDLSGVKQDVILSPLDDGNLLLSFLNAYATYDHRNNALVPTSGFLLGADTTLSEKIIGSDANYYGLGGHASWYLPVPGAPLFTIANNTRLGALFPFADTPEIPISQRFFVGGHNSIRGFRENSLGPKGADGNAIGGDVLFFNNLELQYRIDENLQLASFLDAGTTFLQSRSFSTEDLRESTGLAVRFLTPIGAIGLDVGFPLDKREDESAVRFHLNIGTQF